MTEDIDVVHAIPGRIRLKVAKVKGNPEVARHVQDRLVTVPGIHHVETNPLTGSVLVLYDMSTSLAETATPLRQVVGELFPEVDPLRLMNLLAELRENPRPADNPGGIFLSAATSVNTAIGKLTGGLNLRLLVPLTLVFLGVRSLLVAEKTVFPAWYDYFWFAFSSLVMLNQAWFKGPSSETA